MSTKTRTTALTWGATNALPARLKAVEERRERELDEEATRVAEDAAASAGGHGARRSARRRSRGGARLAAPSGAGGGGGATRIGAGPMQRRVEELERELAMRDAVQEAPAPQSPSKLRVQQLRKSLERPADPTHPPPHRRRRATRRRALALAASNDATTDQCRGHARGRGPRRPGTPRSWWCGQRSNEWRTSRASNWPAMARSQRVEAPGASAAAPPETPAPATPRPS